eukprot:1266220-Prorocentrum_lima.AAC.1
MTSSLVGSEMCIRDRSLDVNTLEPKSPPLPRVAGCQHFEVKATLRYRSCLLYTSDAADDM